MKLNENLAKLTAVFDVMDTEYEIISVDKFINTFLNNK